MSMWPMTFLTIDGKDEETWYDQQEDKNKDKDIGSELVIKWLCDPNDYSWRIEKL